ncbi:MAG: anti-sigma factor [Anaerolineaceae bacterium]
MTDNTEHPLEFLAELALGALTEREAAEIDAHVVGCAECRAELAQMRRVAQLLPFAVEDMAPAPSVKAGLLGRIAAEPRPIRSIPRSRPGLRWPLAIAAAAVTLLVSGGVLGASLFGGSASNRDNERQGSLIKAFAQDTASTSHGEQGGASVTLLRAPGQRDAFVWVANLPPLSAEKAYQAWFIRDGKAEPSTVFRSGSGGVWIEADDAIDRFATMALTIEDGSGAKTPSAAPFVAVELRKTVRSGQH